MIAADLITFVPVTGSIHTGEATGTEEVVHGLNTYIARPESSVINGTIVIIPDVFGWDFVNIRLLADSYAKRGGFKVLLPDFHFGDAYSKVSLDAAFPLKGFEPPLWKRG